MPWQLFAAVASLTIHFWVRDERDAQPGDPLRNGLLVKESLAGSVWPRPRPPSEPRLKMTMEPAALSTLRTILVVLSGSGKASMFDALLGGLKSSFSIGAEDRARFYYLEA
ncbi:MAG: hypothetical protein NT061_09500 [Spirochaetes bacterium]|nr:hypothetical protein [Spirochaetota bacterium]